MVRIHLCQIWYNPAYFDGESDLIEEPAPLLDITQTIGQLRRIESIESLLIEFRASYIKYITDKLCAIARWSQNRGANIIAFPEYSVPPEALPKLRDIAKQAGILIVAGTHRVRFTETSQDVYNSIGLDIHRLKNGSAVSPIIYPSGLVDISVKRCKSKWEPNLDVSSQTKDIHEVYLDSKKLRIAIAPCIDSLHMDILGAFWANKAKKPHIVICPSLSPTIDMFANVGEILASHETLFAFVNSAKFGGTAFNVPQAWQQYLPGIGCCSKSISSDSEAILEIDVNADSFFTKTGSVEVQPPCDKVKDFPIVYTSTQHWVDSYLELEKDIVELLDSSDSASAIEWVDGFLAEQKAPLSDEIVCKLKNLRHGQLVLFSGNIDAIKDALLVVFLTQELEDSRLLFAKRIKQSLDLVTTIIRSTTGADTGALINYLRVLKEIETDFGPQFIQESREKVTAPPIEERLAEFAYKPPESSLASFQDRGASFDQLREIIMRGSEKVLFITGMPGIGKTELVKALFLKVLTDWTPIWLTVAKGSSVSRITAEIGNTLGVTMDMDSLSTATSSVFRQKLTNLFGSFFSIERHALIIDDLRDLRQNVRDYNQLKALIEVAREPKRFKGSRLFLISSVATPPEWVKLAGVTRIHLRGLDDIYLRRVLEYQLRASGLVSGETVPDIPQQLLNTISGHPLAAKIAAETSRNVGITKLGDEQALGELTTNIIYELLPKIELSPEEKEVAETLSVFRLPIKNTDIATVVDDKTISRLASRAIVDFDGHLYSMHPIFQKFFQQQVPNGKETELHRTAASLYKRLNKEKELHGIRDINIVAELAHHLSLAGDFAELPKLQALVFEEFFPAARELYRQRRYDKALQLFMSLAECRPNDPAIWASIGRCYGRRGQWTDSDDAFKKAIDIASATKQPVWWIHRDWGQIRARFGFHTVAQTYLNKAKELGGRDDPSCMAADAYVKWRTDQREIARAEFEYLVQNHKYHGYTLKTYAMLLDELGETDYADTLKAQLEVMESEMIVPLPYDVEIESDIEE